jgi:hypothetical protein
MKTSDLTDQTRPSQTQLSESWVVNLTYCRLKFTIVFTVMKPEMASPLEKRASSRTQATPKRRLKSPRVSSPTQGTTGSPSACRTRQMRTASWHRGPTCPHHLQFPPRSSEPWTSWPDSRSSSLSQTSVRAGGRITDGNETQHPDVGSPTSNLICKFDCVSFFYDSSRRKFGISPNIWRIISFFFSYTVS